MNLKICIKTPVGQAKKTERKIRPFILGRAKAYKIETNDTDDVIIWHVYAETRQAMRINRNVAKFDQLIKYIFTNKLLKKMVLDKISEADAKQLEDMLRNHTKITILKTL